MNRIRISGCVMTEPTFSHEIFGESFFSFYISSARRSGKNDDIRCVVPEVYKGSISLFDAIEVAGEIRTRNYDRADGARGCDVFVFATDINEHNGIEDINEVYAEGYICKSTYRKTPLERDICDVILASNRERSNKSDYIPYIFWGRNALRVSDMEVGTRIETTGRLQSRAYLKHLEGGAEETRVAFEVSAITVRGCEVDE